MEILDTKTKIAEIINKTCQILKRGGLVVVPSDTVYGLAVDAYNPKAVKKLIAFKSRPAGKPISVFVSSLTDFDTYTVVDDKQKQVLKNILPGPYTVVLASRGLLDTRLESEKKTLGLRYINFDFITQLVSHFGKPVTATSANISGTSPRHSVTSLLNSLSQKKKDMIDLVIDFGKLPNNKPSTVIDLTKDELTVLRQGDMRHPEFISGSSLNGMPKQVRHDNRAKVSQFISHSEEDTKKIAKQLIKKWEGSIQKKPLVIILQGELGTGKTQFVKGIGHYFGIENIISPTFVIYYEYKIPLHPKGVKLLYHVDLYNVTEKSEFEHLGFDKMLQPGNVICIEWGEKSSDIYEVLKRKSHFIYVTINYKGGFRRLITITE